MASFLHAIESGADAIELDVHATSDGAIVVNHDATIPRADPAAEPIAISTLSVEALRQLAPAVPTLAQVLEAAAGRAAVYVEIKGTGIEVAVVDCIRNSAARCAVHSFDHRSVRTVSELAPALPTGILLSSYLIDPASALRLAGARDYWLWWEFVDQALVDAVHEAGGRVVAWTANDVDSARMLARLGVDGICSDVAGELTARL